MKKILFVMLLIVTALLLLAACGGEGDTTTQGTGDESTTVLTTAAVSTKREPTAEQIAKNKYAQAGLELALTVCEQYYDLKKHELATSLTARNATTVWPLAAYIEMLAEAYRMFPENETIKKYYTDALDNALRKHMVTNATIKVIPSGEEFPGITYYNAGPNWRGDYYYDDNAWICIQLFDAYEQLGKKQYLTLAEKNLEFLWTGWDKTYGGIYWDKTYSGKGICSNAPTCIAFLTGYQLTGNEVYLERAKLIYDWCNKMLRNTKGLYNAGIKDITATEYNANNLDPWIPAYDQGTMLTCMALFYEITGDKETYYTPITQTVRNLTGHIFNGNQMRGNPIFKSWCIGWLMRGEMMAFKAGAKTLVKQFMRPMNIVLTEELKTKDDNGHYDPFFMSGEWWPPEDDPDADYYDHDAMQPAGVATVFLLMAHYQLYQQ